MTRNILTVVITKFFVLLAALAVLVIQARELGVIERGLLASYMVLPLLLISLTEGGMRQAATYFSGQKKIEKEFIFGALLTYSIISGGIGFVVCYLLLVSTLDIGCGLAVLLSLIVPFNVFISSIKGILLGFEDIKNFNKVLFYQQYVVLFLLCISYVFDMVTITNIVYITLFSYLVNLLSGIFLLSQKNNIFRVKFSLFVTFLMVKKGVVFAIVLFLIELNYKFDVYMLSQLSDSYNLGLYSVSNQLTNLIWQLPSAVGIVLFSKASNTEASSGGFFYRDLVPRTLRYTLFISILSIALLCLLSNQVVSILFGDEYIDSIDIIFSLSVGVVSMVVFKILYVVMAASGSPIKGVLIILPSFIVNLVLNYHFIPKYGAIAAGWSSSASYFLCAIISVLVYRSMYSVSIVKLTMINKDDFVLIFERVKLLFKSRGV